MSADAERDQYFSQILFQRRIKPLLENYFNFKIINVEGDSTPISLVLDRRSGIDYAIETDSDVMGLSNRVQYDPLNRDYYHTFTVRGCRDNGYHSELYKRYHARFKGYFAPHLVCQTYFKNYPYGLRSVEEFDSIPLLRFAIARDVDIIEIAASDVAISKHTGDDKIGQAGFQVVRWDDVVSLRCPILKWYPDSGFTGYVNGHIVNKSQILEGLFNRMIRPRLKVVNVISRTDHSIADYEIVFSVTA